MLTLPDHTDTIEWQARMALISKRAEPLAQLNALVV